MKVEARDGQVPRKAKRAVTGRFHSVILFLCLFLLPGPGLTQEKSGLDPRSSLFYQGETLFHKGDFLGAKAVFEDFLDLYPNEPRRSKAFFRLGQIEIKNRYYSSGLKYFELFTEHFPQSTWNYHAQLKMAECLFHMERYEEAEKRFRATIKVNPDVTHKWEAYSYLARLDDLRMNYDDALKKFKKIIEKGSDEQLLEHARQSVETIVEDKLTKQQLLNLNRVLGAEYPGDLILKRLIQIYRNERDIGNYQIALENFIVRFPDHEFNEEARLALQGLRDQEENGIRIGVVLPLSGQRALVGQQVLQGIQLAYSQFSAANKQQIKLEVRDSGLGRDATGVVEELARDPNVVGIVGPILSWEIQSIIPILEKYRMPVFSPTASTSGLADLSPFVFRNALTKELQARFLARYAVNHLNLYRLAVLYPTEYYGEILREDFEREVRALGGEIVTSISYDRKQNDFREQILNLGGVPDDRLKWMVNRFLRRGAKPPHLNDKGNVSRPIIDGGLFSGSDSEGLKVALEVNYDAIFIPGFYDKVGLMIPQFAFYNIENVLFLGANGWNSPELIEMARHYLNSVLFVDGFFPEGKDPETKKFVDDFEKRFGSKPTVLSAQAYDAANILFQAVLQGGFNRLEIQKRLSEIENYPGVSGVTTMLPSGDTDRSLVKLSVREGRIVPVNGPTPTLD
ncbi:penicillin-binding protein activator [Nitrospina sp. 32_T5]|uniref:penicillin-binding protein activator n=1 Tax=unclassified Nitrospina TaxID=2638683 RepID=UPI003F9BD20E